MNAKSTAQPLEALETAKNRTGKVQQELEVGGAELQLTSTALQRHLPPAVKHGDVARALQQNAAIEVKVNEAAEELGEVTELLEEEAARRIGLERELARVTGK
ncbi:MAG: hypothetical protein ACMG50_09785 [Thermomonas sp.]